MRKLSQLGVRRGAESPCYLVSQLLLPLVERACIRMVRLKFRHCMWILASGEQCPIPVGYRYGKDDDGRKVSVWYSFCDEHQKAVEAQDLAEEQAEGFK
jgi:hypothetical protein